MSENLKAALCLIALAIVMALVQTADFHDQQRIEAEASVAQAGYVAWREAMLRATGDTK